MRRTLALLAAVGLLAFGAAALADGTRAPLLGESARKLMRVGGPWVGHPDSELVRNAVRTGGKLSFYKTPFRLGGEVRRDGSDLVIRIDSLAAKEHVHGWGPFTVVLLNRPAREHGTLGKTVAGIMSAVGDLKAADPTLREVRILAPSLVNKDLTAALRRLGFVEKAASGPGSHGPLVLGRHQSLELTLPVAP